MSLTPEEQRFFETGDASALTPGAPAPAPVDNAALDLAALGTETVPAPAPAAPAPAPVAQTPAPAPTQPDAAEVLRQSLAETERKLVELQAQQKAAQTPAAPAQPPAPDPAEDPLGALLHKLNTMEAQIKQIQEAGTQQTEAQKQMAQFNAFQQQVVGLRNEFVKTHADFDDAYAHLRAVRSEDLKSFGYTPQQIQETLFREEVALSERAIKEARNPAEVAYEMAKRHGYAPKAPAAPAPAPVAGPDAAAIARAQAASRQLPASTPAGGEVELTIEGLRQASEADINKLVLNDATWKKLTGADEYPL